jgi:signal peptidase I
MLDSALGNFRIEGAGMQPTYLNSDYLVTERISYVQIDVDLPTGLIAAAIDAPTIGLPPLRPLQRGDIVVYAASANRDQIKRVIAVGGEEVLLLYGELYIDGRRVPEPYASNTLSLTITSPIKVPLNHVFVLFDDRQRRIETESVQNNVIPISRVRGRVLFRYWPPSRPRSSSE